MLPILQGSTTLSPKYQVWDFLLHLWCEMAAMTVAASSSETCEAAHGTACMDVWYFQLYLVFSCVETVIQAQAGSLCTGKAKSPTLAEQLIPYSFTEKLTSWWEISRWLDHISRCLVCWSRCHTRVWKKKSNWEHPRRDSSLCSILDKENAAGNNGELPWQQALCVHQNC